MICYDDHSCQTVLENVMRFPVSARQYGKEYILRKFAEEYFDNHSNGGVFNLMDQLGNAVS